MDTAVGMGFLIVLVLGAHQAMLERRLGSIERKLNMLLRHAGIAPAVQVNASQRVRELASDPSKKVAAIKALREETGLGLKEAKEVVEILTFERV